MLKYRNKLGLFALVLGLTALSGCGGGSGTGTDQVNFPKCQDPEVLLPGGQCGLPTEPFVPPACPDGQIRNALGVCIPSNFPTPVYKPGLNEAVIYVNVDGTESERKELLSKYNLHLWQACGGGWGNSVTDGKNTNYVIPTTWPNGPFASSSGEPGAEKPHDPYYGAYFIIPISADGTCGNFIVKRPDLEPVLQTNDLRLTISRAGGQFDRMVWVVINKDDMRNSIVSQVPACLRPDCSLERPITTITGIDAHWIDRDTIVWNKTIDPDYDVVLYQSAEAGMSANTEGDIVGGQALATLSGARPMTEEEISRFPHLASYSAYDIPSTTGLDEIKTALKGELILYGRYDSVETETDPVTQEEQEVTVVRGYATRLQTAGALDDIYTSSDNDADEATLGVTYTAGGVGVSVWAPTAQNVELRVFSGQPLRLAENIPMQLDTVTGIWHYQGTLAQLDRKFYRFRVTAFNAVDQRIRRLEVTDPYSISLATDGRYSQFVNLNDADLKPSGWDEHTVPVAGAPENFVIYEAHVRDFSAQDESTPKAYRGKYMAFTVADSAPVNHLKSLVESGLTHIHLLPTNDGGTVPEGAGSQVNLDSYIFELCQRVSNPADLSVCDGSIPNSKKVSEVIASFDTKTSAARDLINAIKDIDGFNWGYDPVHYNAPEGSYATDSNGFVRVKEKRAMIMALHNIGLRTVFDVVYPHTLESGNTSPNSTFDKIVPGYYFRTNVSTGLAENGTGAGSDTATEHRMMAKFVKDSLVHWTQNYKVDGFRFDQSGYMPKAVLTESYDAVRAIDPDNYFYAEAWNPASPAPERIGLENLATQMSLAGTGIGTFNDRMRNPLREFQLFKGGSVDAIRAGLAGNLADFKLKAKNGAIISASTVGAYNLDPQEAINYVEKHDNETLWDWMHKPDAIDAGTSIDNRVRMQNITLSIPVLSQGIPFIHMGSDLLRSKSMTADSYNAGDWFNYVDFTKQTNNWAVGLPPRKEGMPSDAQILSAFNDVNSKPSPEHIEFAGEIFKEMLAIAKNSPLFSLQTAQEVFDRVGFQDGGKSQKAGVIVMSIDDGAGVVSGTEDVQRADLDPALDAMVVVFNGTTTAQTLTVPTATGFELHDIQKNSVDEIVRNASFAEAVNDEIGGNFTVPAFTTAVFVKKQAGGQGVGLSAGATLDLPDQEPPPYASDVYVRGNVYDDDWSAVDATRMAYHGRGIYSVVLDIDARVDAYKFKIAAADWNVPNLGANATVVLGAPLVLNQGGDSSDISINITESGLYRFELDASSSLTAPTITVVKEQLNGGTVYLRGNIPEVGWDATTTLNQLSYTGKGIYSVAVDVAAAEDPYSFKIASSDWSTFNFGNGSSIDLGEEAPVSQGGDNIGLTVSISATYRFELNMQDPAVPTVKVYADNVYSSLPIYIRGNVSSDWGATDANQLAYSGSGLYTLKLNLAANNSYQFKVAAADWGALDFGSSNSAVLGTPVNLVAGGSNIGLSIASEGEYVFTLDTANPEALTVTVDSAD
ncbi:alpha-1,6-glucosidase domain-containing protein [Cellvibrio japonicus]|uniref:Pullulanase, putative, pul13B n=1 Tax=Cellvibrio japonicus (strain Ueda107) TaxID=498211 RepID=B3PDV8_CELJU|nr:alpha-1,6-glucosidase domain-containing protein [Cellvibrio japonicus]ACE82691.1 pullulanase, putative, pul13B [Cellvibrio japonicus Ueda107]QEI13443.1 DUF3372 domain-containing protein [Cellvibrio japonicus]QEI17017.1 DUF3372 domain-containing protein [Cellvibrio japonicus]QEI20595.1 DUF3372 domain-containing protein [Cellvibrio japonicus]